MRQIRWYRRWLGMLLAAVLLLGSLADPAAAVQVQAAAAGEGNFTAVALTGDAAGNEDAGQSAAASEALAGDAVQPDETAYRLFFNNTKNWQNVYVHI